MDQSSTEKCEPSSYINLKVSGQNHILYGMKIPKYLPLKRLMDAYYEKTGIQKGSLKFVYGSRVVCNEDTAISLELEHNDIIKTYKIPNPDERINAKMVVVNYINRITIITHFIIEKETPIKNLKGAFCQYFGIEASDDILLRFNNRVLSANDTPTTIGLENESVIEVFKVSL